MAATPPPYTPQDARWQAKQARATARAQRDQWKAQARAQRDYYRQYWRGFRRPSFVGPIVLLSIGILALVLTTGRIDAVTFWSWYAQWWPLILIGLGGLLLAEYFLEWNRPWAGRRPVGGLFWLVIVIIGLGFISREGRLVGPFAWQFSDNGSDDFFSWMGPEHDNDVQMDQILNMARPAVAIDNPHGDIILTASVDNQMHLRAHEMVHRSSEDEAKKIFAGLRPRIEASAGGVVVSVPGRDGARVDLTLELPAASFATLTAGHGDVTADGINGGIQVTSSHGDVKLEDIGGDAQGHIDHGDFAAHNVQGHLILNGQGEDVTLSEIRGAATVDGEFYGDIHVEQLGGALHYHSSMTTLDIPRLFGSVTLDKDNLSISKAAGPIRIAARSKDIDLTQIAGDAHIDDSNGDISMAAAAPLGNLQISDDTGNVIVTVPQDAGFTVHGSASADESIRTDFPLKVAKEGDRQRLEGSVGNGGAQLQLQTEHGNLELRKGDSGTLVMTPPEPPRPPAPPAMAKHFHAPAGAKAPLEQEQ